MYFLGFIMSFFGFFLNNGFLRRGLYFMVVFALFSSGAAVLTIDGGYRYPLVFLFVVGVLFFGRRGIDFPRFNKIFLCWAVFGLFLILMMLWHGDEFKKPWRFLVYFMPVFVCYSIFLFRIYPGFWFDGIAIGAIVTACWSLYQVVFLDVSRAGWHVPLIQHGNIGLIMSMVSFLAILYFKDAGLSSVRVAIYFLGGAGGVMVSVLSGSKGGWVAFPILILGLWYGFYPYMNSKARRNFLLIIVSFSTLLVMVPQTGVVKRLSDMASEFSSVSNGGPYGPSVGQRLVMWPNALEMAFERPVLGWGHSGYANEIKKDVDSGGLDLARAFQHPHSDTINFFVKYGGILLMLNLAAIILPALFFGRQLPQKNCRIRAISCMGFLLPVMVFIFGLTDLFVASMAGGYLYYGWMSILIGFYVNEIRNENS